MSALAATPVLVPLATAALAVLCAGQARLQRALSFAGALLLLGCALALVARAAAGQPAAVAFGGWDTPYGIGFALDPLGSVLVLVTALMGLATLLFLCSDVDPGPRHPLLLPLLHGTLAGVGGAFATADLFNLYVWFEVMLVCALGLFVLGLQPRQLDAAFKYLALNLFGTLLLLAAVGLVYGATGHLNFDALAAAAPQLPPALVTALLAVLMVALLLKSGAFPLFAWLPAAYHTLPTPVLALVAGLLTKVGVYALLRTLGDVFAPSVDALLLQALGWVAAATMLAGVLGAAYHWDLRRILAFHIISQIGYILLAVALGGLGGHAAALFYTVHHIVVKANLFLVAGLVCVYAGSFDLRRAGGLYAARPALALLFAVPALSLVGVPPLSGFWAKLMVLQEAMAQQRVAWAVLALLVSVLTLYSMMKVWMEAFWKPHPDVPPPRQRDVRLWPAWAACTALAAVTLAVGLQPQLLADYAQHAAAALGSGR
ncbi:complex I subunit 5 family protein [Azohydromonas aeria]|uniref:complex I subunit 5 family protein n=1 Tax=Azohydromonas aeria TaxID=2590212 RepID=UPI0012F9C1F4|nr:proton-conducting transporter membrane subunit [Azohydromonas aeria]